MGAQHGREDMNEISAIRERLVALEQLLAGQQQQMAQQEAEIERLRSALAGAQDAPALILPAATKRKQLAGLASRRSLLKLGGVAAAAGVAATAVSVARNAPPAYAAGTQWVTGTVNADTETLVKPNGSGYSSADILQLQLGTGSVYAPLGGQANAAKAALTAYDTTSNNIGVYATSATGFGLFGVTNTGTGATGAGLNGTGNSTGTGVSGNSQSGVGVQGNSTTGVGGAFTGGQAPLALGLASAPGAPTTGTHVNGEIYADSLGALWVCNHSGTFGTGTPPSFYQLSALIFLPTPIRVLDTRGFGAPITNGNSPLGGGQTLTAQIVNTSVGGLSVPAGATAIIGNLTALPFSNGDLTIYASGQPKPNASNLNYSTGINVANSVLVKLSSNGAVDIYSNVGTCNVILDITGYIH